MIKLDKAIRQPVPIAPMPILAHLRICVTSRTTKRMPKWKIEFKPFVIPHEQADFSDDGDWYLKPTRVGFRTGPPLSDIFLVRDRLIETLPTAFDKLRPEMMVQHACLFCGKRLTDPVSMARWIGPECAGTAAAITPFVVNLSE